ncbi:MAG TPA: SDR family oxidoreductase [Clostridiales bacterium]|nr:SDR family oxidoreductase [Clostridiales bacterium]
MKRMEGKVAVITGAGNGMGKATAELFLEEGAKVVGVDIAKGTLDYLNENADGLAVYADITTNSGIEDIAVKAMEKFGRIDVLCNIAGINDLCRTMDETTEEVWDRVINLDLKAPFMLSKRIVAEMVKNSGNKKGAILNIGSLAAYAGNHGPSYSAAKHGLVGLTMSMAVGLIQQGIRTNCIHPGGVKTDIETHSGGKYSEKGMQMLIDITGKWPANIGGYADTIDIARAALFLCSDESNHINGAFLPVDNGMSVSG